MPWYEQDVCQASFKFQDLAQNPFKHWVSGLDASALARLVQAVHHGRKRPAHVFFTLVYRVLTLLHAEEKTGLHFGATNYPWGNRVKQGRGIVPCGPPSRRPGNDRCYGPGYIQTAPIRRMARKQAGRASGSSRGFNRRRNSAFNQEAYVHALTPARSTCARRRSHAFPYYSDLHHRRAGRFVVRPRHRRDLRRPALYRPSATRCRNGWSAP